MIRRILVPLDGSRSAERAIPHAVVLARVFGAHLHLLRVLPREAGGGLEPVDPLAWRIARASAASYLTDLARDLETKGLTIEAEVQEGLPSDIIVSTVARGRFHLVVLTSHGEGRGSAFAMGGTALAVAMNAGSSIMIVPEGGPEPAEASEDEYGQILAMVDCSPRCDWTLGVAARIARETGSRLLITHVATMPEVVSRGSEPWEGLDLAERIAESNRKEGSRYLAQMQERLASGTLEVETRVLDGPHGVASAVMEFAAARGVGLIVLSAVGRGGGPNWPFGGTAAKLVLGASRPTLILRDRVLSVRTAQRYGRPRLTRIRET